MARVRKSGKAGKGMRATGIWPRGLFYEESNTFEMNPPSSPAMFVATALGIEVKDGEACSLRFNFADAQPQPAEPGDTLK